MKLSALFAFGLLGSLGFAGDFTLTLLHTNDLHGRVEPAMIKGQPFGGYAKHVTLIDQYRKQDENVLLLNAGDTFQGTLFFSQYGGLADLIYMNHVKYDAMALGNHEFDKGPGLLSEFAKRAQFPLLCCNMDFSAEPLLKDLIKPFSIVKVGGESIGIVGVMTEDLESLSSPGPTVKILPAVASAQKAIDELQKQKVNKIVLLTHVGFAEDKKLATELTGVDVIVGGHSHTPLGDFEFPGGRQAEGIYPVPAKDKAGNKVLITQAWEWGKVMGRLKIVFDDKGNVKSVYDAKPILIDNAVKEDPFMKATVDALAQPIMSMRLSKVAVAETALGRSREGESELGNLIADSMLAKTSSLGALAAIMNPGGIRQSVEPGPITVETCINVQPFGNTLVLLDLNIGELKEVFENGASFPLQISETLKVTYDMKKPVGERVVGISLSGQQLWPIPPNVRIGSIRIVTNNFLAGGGDGVLAMKNAKGRRLDTGFIDVDAFIEYLKVKGNVTGKKDGRISFVKS